METEKLSGTRILIPSGAGAPGFGGIVRCLREFLKYLLWPVMLAAMFMGHHYRILLF